LALLQKTEVDVYDIAIIGAGPAGLSAALYALRAGKKVVIFEGNAFGGILNTIDRIENYPGFKAISGEALAKKMAAQVMRFKPKVVKSFAVSVLADDMDTDNEGEEGGYTVYTNASDFKARCVIYAGGSVRAPLPAAEKFKGSGLSYCALCDGYFYKDKTVAVLGSGYTAEEDARYLIPLCKKVYVLGGVAVDGAESIDDGVAELIGSKQEAGKGEVLEAVKLKSGRVLKVDGLFIALGVKDSGGVLSAVLDGQSMQDGKIKDGLYVAGDAGAEFKQIVWAAASGAKAASDAVKAKPNTRKKQ